MYNDSILNKQFIILQNQLLQIITHQTKMKTNNLIEQRNLNLVKEIETNVKKPKSTLQKHQVIHNNKQQSKTNYNNRDSEHANKNWYGQQQKSVPKFQNNSVVSTLKEQCKIELNQEPKLNETFKQQPKKKFNLDDLKLKYLKKNDKQKPQQIKQKNMLANQYVPKVLINNIQKIKNQQTKQIKQDNKIQIIKVLEQNKILESSSPIQPKIKIQQLILLTDPILPSNKPEYFLIKSKAQSKTNFIDILFKKPKAMIQKPIQKNRINSRDPFDLKGTYETKLLQYNESQQRQRIVKNQDIYNNEQKSQTKQFQNECIQQLSLQQNNKKSNKQIKLINLIKNIPQLIDEIYSNSLIDYDTYLLINQRVIIQQKNQQKKLLLDLNSNNQNFTPWVRAMFQKFIMSKFQLNANHFEVAFEFISEFFPPSANKLSQIFIINLIKLSEEYYQKFGEELINNIFHYLKIIIENKNKYTEQKKMQFLTFLIKSAYRFRRGNDYCKIVIHILYLEPDLITQDILQNYNKQLKHFAYAALLFLLLNKTKNKFMKDHIINLYSILKFFEEQGLIQESLELIKNANEIMGTIAYSTLRDTREKLINRLTIINENKQRQAKSSNKNSGIFGFFNQALDKIKSNKSTDFILDNSQKQSKINQYISASIQNPLVNIKSTKEFDKKTLSTFSQKNIKLSQNKEDNKSGIFAKFKIPQNLIS